MGLCLSPPSAFANTSTPISPQEFLPGSQVSSLTVQRRHDGRLLALARLGHGRPHVGLVQVVV